MRVTMMTMTMTIMKKKTAEAVAMVVATMTHRLLVTDSTEQQGSCTCSALAHTTQTELQHRQGTGIGFI